MEGKERVVVAVAVAVAVVCFWVTGGRGVCHAYTSSRRGGGIVSVLLHPREDPPLRPRLPHHVIIEAQFLLRPRAANHVLAESHIRLTLHNGG